MKNKLNILWCNTTGLKQGFNPNHFVFFVYQEEANNQNRNKCKLKVQDQPTSIYNAKPPVIVLHSEEQSQRKLPLKIPQKIAGSTNPQTNESKITSYFAKKVSKEVCKDTQNDEMSVQESCKRKDADVKVPIQVKKQ